MNSGRVVHSLTALAKSSSFCEMADAPTCLAPVDCARMTGASARKARKSMAGSRAGLHRWDMTELLICVVFKYGYEKVVEMAVVRSLQFASLERPATGVRDSTYDQRCRDQNAAVRGAILPSIPHGQ